MTIQDWFFIIGLVVAMIAYFAKNFVFEPLMKFNMVRGRIHGMMKYYANAIGPGVKAELQIEASSAIRKLSCDLDEAYYGMSFRWMLSHCRLLPKKQAIEDASKNLIGLSNSTGPRVAGDRSSWELPKEIRKNLNIPYENN